MKNSKLSRGRQTGYKCRCWMPSRFVLLYLMLCIAMPCPILRDATHTYRKGEGTYSTCLGARRVRECSVILIRILLDLIVSLSIPHWHIPANCLLPCGVLWDRGRCTCTICTTCSVRWTGICPPCIYTTYHICRVRVQTHAVLLLQLYCN